MKSAGAQRQARRNPIRRRPATESTAGAALAHRDMPARLVELQRTHGNAFVSRLIANSRDANTTGERVQRDGAAPISLNPRAAGGGAAAPAAETESDPVAAMGDGWKPIYKLIAEQLGEEKLKEYGKTLASKGVDLLVGQAKDAKDTSFLDKAQLDLLGTMLADHAKKVAEDWVTSPAGKAFRERLLTITKDAPGVVVAAAIAGAAIAYLANPDLPEIKPKFDIFKGLSAEGTLDIGKIQSMTVQKASGALKFTSSHFKAGLSGEFVGEGDKKGTTLGASAAVSDKEISFKTAMKLNPDGSVKIDLGPAIDMKKFGIESGVSITGSDMSAIVGVRIGDKDTFVSAKTKIDPDGKVSLDLGIKAAGIAAEGKVKGIGSDKTSGEASLTGSNIFGVKGLDAKGTLKFSPGTVNAGGSISYSADTKHGKAFISFSGETLHGDQKDGPAIGAQGVIGVGFRFGGTK